MLRYYPTIQSRYEHHRKFLGLQCVSKYGLAFPHFQASGRGSAVRFQRGGYRWSQSDQSQNAVAPTRGRARLGGRGIAVAVTATPVPGYQQISCPYFETHCTSSREWKVERKFASNEASRLEYEKLIREEWHSVPDELIYRAWINGCDWVKKNFSIVPNSLYSSI